jgi:hypothetical protein
MGRSTAAHPRINPLKLVLVASLKPIGSTWSYLACRIGHLVPIWQPLMVSSFQSCDMPPDKSWMGPSTAAHPRINPLELVLVASLKPIGSNWSYLACRIGHLVPIWQPLMGSSFQSCDMPPDKGKEGPNFLSCISYRTNASYWFSVMCGVRCCAYLANSPIAALVHQAIFAFSAAAWVCWVNLENGEGA